MGNESGKQGQKFFVMKYTMSKCILKGEFYSDIKSEEKIEINWRYWKSHSTKKDFVKKIFLAKSV